MKNTPLTQLHIDLGAKMAEFAGYNMPIVYTNISDEHEAVRNSVGIFDVSHMGEFILKGQDAELFLQRTTSNDASKLEVGEAQYSCIPNDNGGIVDDLLIYRLPEDKCAEGEQAYMLVVNASNMQKDWDWFMSKKGDLEISLENTSDRTGLLAVQGPKAVEVINKLVDLDASTVKYYTFIKGEVANTQNVILSATGYTGSGGFEIYAHNEDLPKLWSAVMEAGEEFGIKPCGLGARDTLRLEMGFCLYGNDIDDTTSPIEAGLSWITKLKKKEDFSSKSVFQKQKEEGITRKLVAFTLDGRRVPRHGYDICTADGEKIGVVTSGTQSPSLDHPIGLGYVTKADSKIGNTIYIRTGKKLQEAQIVKLPFYKK